MQDETGSTSAITLFCSSSLTVSEIDADAAALASILLPLSGAVLIKQRIKYVSVPDEPLSWSDSTPITKTGIFFFSTGTSTPDALVSVPAIKDSIVKSDGPSAGVGIDLLNSDVMAFAAAVVEGGFSNPFADVFELLFAAYIQSRI
jgi:hypothetical protein